MDEGKLLSPIEVAEARFFQNGVLGWNYFTELSTQKNQLVTTSNLAAMQALFTAQNAATNIVLKPGDYVNSPEFLTAKNKEFWYNGLWKLVAECAYYIGIPENYADFTNQGITKNNPVSSVMDQTAKTDVGVSLADVKFLMDQCMMNRIEPLKEGVYNYLLSRTADYPTWAAWAVPATTGDCCGSGGPSLAVKTTPWVDLSIYRDEDEYPGRNCQWP